MTTEGRWLLHEENLGQKGVCRSSTTSWGQDGIEPGIHPQRRQAVGYVGPLTFVRYDTRITAFKRRKRRNGPDGDTLMKKQTMIPKKTLNKTGGACEENLETIQNGNEEAAKKVAHTTKARRQKDVMNTPKEVKEAGRSCHEMQLGARQKKD